MGFNGPPIITSPTIDVNSRVTVILALDQCFCQSIHVPGQLDPTRDTYVLKHHLLSVVTPQYFRGFHHYGGINEDFLINGERFLEPGSEEATYPQNVSRPYQTSSVCMFRLLSINFLTLNYLISKSTSIFN